MGSLSNVEAFLLSSIVDDCLRRIQIVGEVSQYTKIEDLNESARGGGSDDEDDILPPEEDKTFLYTVKQLTSTEKFKLDRKSMQVALNNVAQELKHDISFETLKKFNEDYESNRREIKELHERLANQYRLIPKLKNDIEDIKIDSQKEMDGLDNQIDELNFQLQKLKTQFSMERSYLKKQCTNTIEDTKRTCDVESQKAEDRVKQLGRRIEYEVKSDKEISKYNKMNEVELLKTLKYHKAKFFDDERVMKNKIRTVQVYREYNSGKINDIVQKLKVIKEVFLEDQREKEEEQRKLDNEQERLECAVEIQAWWRGTMVRKGLGPYASMKKEKKEKKGKEGKDKDKKEKKNKDKKEKKNKDKKEKKK